MSERDGYERGVPCWVDILQADPEAAKRFYAGLFGWEFTGAGAMPGDYFVAQVAGSDVAGVGSQPSADPPPAPAWNTYVWVDNADEAAESVTSAGGDVHVEPMDVMPAGRMAVVSDPAGAAFCLWEAGDRKGAERVNEPGAWSMSSLNTRDPEAANGFYAEVFSWQAETMSVGDGEFTLFRLPGYVGGEPEQPVPRDVVATMAPMGDRFGDSVPPHWGVDFWVAELDATVEKADQLGGKVVVPPYEIPDTPLRQAVLADPQGAPFSVTKVTIAG